MASFHASTRSIPSIPALAFPPAGCAVAGPLPAIAGLPADVAIDDVDPAEPVEPTGCGWYESSHSLRSGVQVIEHSGFERLQGLPLGWLLGAYFGADAGLALAA